MPKLPESWGKGSLPNDWGKDSSIHPHLNEKIENKHNQVAEETHIKIEATDKAVDETTNSESCFFTGDEIKAKFNSTMSEIDKGITDVADSVKNNVQSVSEKVVNSAKLVKDKTKSKIKKAHRRKNKQEKNIDEVSTPKTEDVKKGNQFFNKKVLIIALLTVVIIAAVGLTVFFFDNTHSNHSEKVFSEKTSSVISSNAVSTKEQQETSSRPNVSSSSTTSTKTTPNLNHYVGYWYVGEENDQELKIENINQDTIKFSLWYYRLTSIDDVTVKINDNIAAFSYLSNENIAKGYLTFEEASITVTITETNIEYLPLETVFDSHYDHSLVNMSGEVSGDYEEEPNVYCPNCNYGYFVTGVGISGFECPQCHYKFNYPVDSHSQEFFEISGYYEEYDVTNNDEHVNKDNYDGQLYLYSDGTGTLYSMGTEIYFNWDVGQIWDSSVPSERVSFETNDGYLTFYLSNGNHWIFKKIY